MRKTTARNEVKELRGSAAVESRPGFFDHLGTSDADV